MEYQPIKFFEWMSPTDGKTQGALYTFAATVPVLILFGLLIGFLRSSATHGPAEGFYRTASVLFSAILDDLAGFSFRRTFAIMRLAITESIRRKVIIAFAIFAIVLLMAGWFLDSRNEHPERIYLSFVLQTSNFLVLFLSVLLAALSLPADMKSRTIYTIVTKPVRASEIILGRVLGFSVVGTIILGLMGVCSYIFVVRAVSHTHVVDPDSIVEKKGRGGKTIYEGKTLANARVGHEHRIVTRPNGEIEAELKKGHTHAVTRNEDGTFTIGPPEGSLLARLPIYGQMRFFDRQGLVTDKATNVGYEKANRQYVDGATKMAAEWTFEGVTKKGFPDGIPLEMNIRIYRSNKGDIERRVAGHLIVRGGDSKVSSYPLRMRPTEFETYRFTIPRRIQRIVPDERGDSSVIKTEETDLFDTFVDDGKLRIVLQCIEPGQYYGVAPPDIYIRAANAPFYLNFAKGYFAIWLQMLVAISVAVMFSAMVTGPIAVVGTIASLVLGYNSDFIREIYHGVFNQQDQLAWKSGGPIECCFRVATQQNMQSDLEAPYFAKWIMQQCDARLMQAMEGLTYILPDLNQFDVVEYVASGFDIDQNTVAIMVTKTIAYVIGACAIGYFAFKTREIAAE